MGQVAYNWNRPELPPLPYLNPHVGGEIKGKRNIEESRYDLLVIGAGSAGLAAVGLALRLKLRVGLVEADRVGGDCTWAGCVPSKSLINQARRIHYQRQLDPALQVDFEPIAAAVLAAIDNVYAQERPETLAGRGVDYVAGRARFVDAHTIAVGERRITARRFLIATGAVPVAPPIEGLVDTSHFTHRSIFDIERIPRRLGIVGAGAVGVEMAQAFQRLGSQVVLFDTEKTVLPAADPEIGGSIGDVLQSEGVGLRLGTKISRVDQVAGGITLSCGDSVACDALLIAAGRQPNLGPLGLDAPGVAVSDGAVVIDRRLRTTQHHIYAAGDVTGRVHFTHYAGWQGFMAVRNAFLPFSANAVKAHPLWAVFTDPEAAHTGMTEAQARAKYRDVTTFRIPAAAIDRAQTAGQELGFIKLVSRSNRRVLGASIVGQGAADQINELSLEIEKEMTLGNLAETMHVYPTYGTSIQIGAAEGYLDRLFGGWTGRAAAWLARKNLRL